MEMRKKSRWKEEGFQYRTVLLNSTPLHVVHTSPFLSKFVKEHAVSLGFGFLFLISTEYFLWNFK